MTHVCGLSLLTTPSERGVAGPREGPTYAVTPSPGRVARARARRAWRLWAARHRRTARVP